VRAGLFDRSGPPTLTVRRPAVPDSQAMRLARTITRIAGRICQSKRQEWWADLLYDQQVKNETGLGHARSCLLNSASLAWPEIRLHLVSATVATAIEVGFTILRTASTVIIQLAAWSPQMVGLFAVVVIGDLAPLRITAHPEMASVVILTPVGIYAGKTFPRELLRTLGAAGGAVLGIHFGNKLAGSMSIPLFATPGMVLGGAAGELWADQVFALQGVTGSELALRMIASVARAMSMLAARLAALKVATTGAMRQRTPRRTHGQTSRPLVAAFRARPVAVAIPISVFGSKPEFMTQLGGPRVLGSESSRTARPVRARKRTQKSSQSQSRRAKRKRDTHEGP
jgi:hypothetical protein